MFTAGWRVPLKIPKDNCRKFKPSSKSTEAGWDNKRKADGDTFTHPNKRIKLQEIQNTSSNLPKGHRPHVVLTGYTVREKEKYSDVSSCAVNSEYITAFPSFLPVPVRYYITPSFYIVKIIYSIFCLLFL